MNINNQFNHGIHTHHHNYQQDSLPLETRSERTTISLTPTEKTLFENYANGRDLSPILRELLFVGLKYSQTLDYSLRELLDKIIR